MPRPGGGVVDHRVRADGVRRRLHVLGDHVAEDGERRLARLARVAAGELGEVVREREVWVLDRRGHLGA